MTKVKVSKKVLRRAKNIVEAEVVEENQYAGSPLPVVRLWYPLHGKGEMTPRYVRMVQMDRSYVRGFELKGEFDTSIGQFKTFSVDLMGPGGVLVLHMPYSV